MDSPVLQFPPSFRFGSATASYQIEGAVHADGRGESIWDRFSHTPGKVRAGETGDIADDFYHRYREDIQLMQELGLDTFRFSIAWPRILPNGTGSVNSAGLDFYDRVVDELLTVGIEPFATLYHWDLPQALEDNGGWLNRDTSEAFAEYTGAVTRRLGDRVKNWITLNEPWVSAWLGYANGEHAPGVKKGAAGALPAGHNLLRAHGLAMQVIRQTVPDAQAGITLNLSPVYPASQSPEDLDAARIVDGHSNRWLLDPVFRGVYPADMQQIFGQEVPDVRPGDLDLIKQPMDFLGINNYSRHVVKAGPNGPEMVKPANSHYTNMGWEVYPEGIHDLVVRVHQEYGVASMYITENGAAFQDVISHDGAIHDLERRDYIQQYLGQIGRAVQEGVPVHGYFVWSLMDNFEWALGYWMRFGLIYVDYPSLERIPKDSYRWYQTFLAERKSAAVQ